MKYDFDTIVDRSQTLSIKYDFKKERNKPEDVIPLWVADMDFKTPAAVTEKLIAAMSHGIYGYSEAKESYNAAIQNWMLSQFGWQVDPNWIVKTPGVVFAIAMGIRAFSSPGDSILIQQPVYYPFGQTIRANQRNLVNNPLQYENGRYIIDFEDFEEKIVKNDVKIFVLASPHNPVGRVWTKDELTKMAKICLKHNVLVISDEIHADFVWENNTHTVFAALGDEYAQNCIVCTAPSKTFNLAGLQVSNIIIPNARLRRQFIHEIDASGYSQLSLPGLIACEAAYTYGNDWYVQVKKYIWENILFLKEFLAQKIPQVRLVHPEGTYLAWLDCQNLSMNENEREAFLLNEAKIWLDKGTMFGKEGAGFERINVACPRATLEKACNQLQNAWHNW